MSRRKITLYIGNEKADLSDDSLVQMNYTQSDLAEPAAVKNSYSQQVKLPGTGQNDAIFGAIYRSDWLHVAGNSYTGTGFDPLIRTPFSLYDETGALLESGYLKLNSVTEKNGVRTYTVTLYGGLGSFFYSLSYDEEGEEITLGALPFLGGAPGANLNDVGFIIDKNAVYQAWARLAGQNDLEGAEKWDVVNFAPAYNGIPSGDFSADKAVGDPSIVGGQFSTEKDGVTYTTYGPNHDVLYDFGDEFNEWQTKDLRSYMQRPVVSVKGVLEGIRRYAEAKGFGLDLDPSWFHGYNPYYAKTWMTLPLIAGRSVKAQSEEYTVETPPLLTDQVWANHYVYPTWYNIYPITKDPGATVTVTCKTPSILIQPLIFSGASVEDKIYLNTGLPLGNAARGTIAFIQLQLLDGTGQVVAGSKIQVCVSNSGGVLDGYTAQQLVDMAMVDGFLNMGYGVNDVINSGPCIKEGLPGVEGDVWQYKNVPDLEATAINVEGARVCVVFRTIYTDTRGAVSLLSDRWLQYAVDGYGSALGFINKIGVDFESAAVEYSLPETYRSGVEVTQSQLFADTMTPASFLLSYTKTFGLHYLYDKGTKRVRIVPRNVLYDGQTLDFQERIDRSSEITVQPIPMDAKWLEFSPQQIDGEFAEYYMQKAGREYGIQKVNTGFDFDANTTDVMSSAKFNGGAEVLEKSKYFNNVTFEGRRTPSPFLNGQASYRLYANGNIDQSIELDDLTPSYLATITYFNTLQSYDAVPKLQCHSKDDSATDGGSVLLFHRGNISEDAAAAAAYARFRITDDSQAMYDLNDGTPCWELSEGVAATLMPIFGRFDTRDREIVHSQEYGIPAALDIPGAAIGRDTTVYEQFWRAYIADRYNAGTRTLTAYVYLRGLQVEEELLRHFYYFDGAIWVLNKIENYLLTTEGTTKCEFVKVQDTAAYTSGQLLPPDYYLKLDGQEGDVSRSIDTAGGVLTIPVDTNGTVAVLTASQGVTATIENGTLALDVAANGSASPVEKSVTVCLVEAPEIRRTVAVSQAAAAAVLLVNNSSMPVQIINAAADPHTMIISVVSNGTPVLQSYSAELIVRLLANVLNIRVPANTTTASRDFSIVLGMVENSTIRREIILRQAGLDKSYYLKLNGLEGNQLVMASANGETLTYTVDTNGTPYIVENTLGLRWVTLTDTLLTITVPGNLQAQVVANTVTIGLTEDPDVRNELRINQPFGGVINPAPIENELIAETDE